MKYVPIALLLFTSGCASRIIDRRQDDRTELMRTIERKSDETVKQSVDVNEKKVNKRVKRTPVLKPDGSVATLPDGQPAVETEETIETTDTFTETITEVVRKLEEAERLAAEIQRTLQERERRIHLIKLLWLGGLVLCGFGAFVYLAIKKRWVFGWFW